MVSVFDLSQTDGEELPEIHGYQGEPAENLERLEAFVKDKGIELSYEEPGGGALGISYQGAIKVSPTLSPAETFAVLAHEVAHELLHMSERRTASTALDGESILDFIHEGVPTTGFASKNEKKMRNGKPKVNDAKRERPSPSKDSPKNREEEKPSSTKESPELAPTDSAWRDGRAER